MKKIFVSLLVLLLGASLASASYITLDTTVTAKIDGQKLKVLVSVINKGDESAHNVQAEILAGNQKIMADKVSELGVNSTYKGFATFNLQGKKPGVYPLIITMHYADANQYPFSALTARTFAYKSKDLPANLFGKMKGKTFWKDGRLDLTIKNLSQEEINASVRLITPRELSVVEEEKRLTIGAKKDNKLGFNLNNFSALSGSSYQVFALAQYQKGGLHQTTVVPATVVIRESNFFRDNLPFILGIIVILLATFIFFQFKQ